MSRSASPRIEYYFVCPSCGAGKLEPCKNLVTGAYQNRFHGTRGTAQQQLAK